MAGTGARKASHVILFYDTPAPARCQEQIAQFPMQSDCYEHGPAVASIDGRADVLRLRADGRILNGGVFHTGRRRFRCIAGRQDDLARTGAAACCGIICAVKPIVSVFLDHLDFFDEDVTNLPLHGANLMAAQLLRRIAACEEAEALECFVPPHVYIDTKALTRAAERALPQELRGKGALRFYPIQGAQDVWADGAERVLLALDLMHFPGARYLRDTFARAPMPIAVDTHGLGAYRYWPPLAGIAGTSPVAYDSIVCLTDTYRRAVRKSFTEFLSPGREPPCRLDVLAHGVDSELFFPADERGRMEARQLLRLPTDCPIVLYFGRVTPYDKADLLPVLRAWARLPASCGNLVIVGGEGAPGYIERLRSTASELGIAGRVLFEGQVPASLRPLWYRASDVFLFPSDTIQEAQGSTLAEAMASGLPVVSTDWDGSKNIVRDGETGIRVPTRMSPSIASVGPFSCVSTLLMDYFYASQCVTVDPDALAAALKKLTQDAGLRKRMGKAGRRVVEEELSWAAIMPKWSQLWAELLDCARAETPEEAAQRRRSGTAVGLAPPMERIFSHYATRMIDPETDRFRLTMRGLSAAAGEKALEFFDETLPLVLPKALDAIFEVFASSGNQWLTGAAVCDGAAGASGVEPARILLHLTLLLKLEFIELQQVAS